MKLTINEIAELAQVAKSTVSKALNGQKGVSEEKRKLILRLAEQLNYHPNASAQALALHRTSSIGFVLPYHAGLSLSGAYWSAMITAVAQEARSHNYNVLILSPDQDDDVGVPIDSVLKRRNVDGLILGAEHLDTKTVSTLILEDLPFVLIGRNPSVRHYSVDVDNEAASRTIVSHLVAKGRKKIACLAGPKEHLYIQQRCEGYYGALRDAGIEWSAVEYSDYILEDVTAAIERLIDKSGGIDALFMTAGGEFVLDAIEAIRRRKGDLSDFSMAVFDDYRFFDYLSIPISRLRQPLNAMATMAASLLFEIMSGKKPDKLEWVFQAEAVLR